MSSSPRTEGAVLAKAMDAARKNTLYYFDKLKDRDLQYAPSINGVELNSAHWIMAHLATTENGLLLFATGGAGEKFSWAKHYMNGTMPPAPELRPAIDDVLATMQRVHEQAMAHISAMDSAALSAPLPPQLAKFGTELRDVVNAAIRHEGYHCGQLGWSCKIHGIKTV